jgi:phosphoglycerate dehydrogenase-like enzyme
VSVQWRAACRRDRRCQWGSMTCPNLLIAAPPIYTKANAASPQIGYSMRSDPIALYDDDLDFDLSKQIFAHAGITLLQYSDSTDEDRRRAIALLCSFRPLDDRELSALPSLRVVSLSTHDSPDVQAGALSRRGIRVATVSAQTSNEEVVLHTLLLILAAVRKLHIFMRATRNGQWDYRIAAPISRMSEMTLAIIGIGRIGRAVASRAQPMFKRIIAFDPANAGASDLGVEIHNLDHVLEIADVVSLHVRPSSDQYLLGPKEFGKMKSGAVVVNCARAELIDERALLDALDSGRVSAAALDVIQRPATEAGVRLLRHARTIVTPHCAFYSDAAVREYTKLQAENAIRCLTS